jgi:hypothetical protein
LAHPERKRLSDMAAEKAIKEVPPSPPSLPDAEPQAEQAPAFQRLPLATRVGIVKDIAEMLAILAAGIWAIYTFNKEFHENARREKPAWSPKLTLERIGERNNEVAIRATLLLENKGTARQNFWAGTLNVGGWRLQPTGDGGLTDSPIVPTEKRNWTEWRGFKQVDKRSVASFGLSVTPDGPTKNAFVDPGDKYERNYIFYVNPNQVDFVEATITLLVPENAAETVRNANWIAQKETEAGVVLAASAGCEGATPACPANYTTSATVQMALWKSKEPEPNSEKP